MDCGIYLITNTISGKLYVGSTKNLRRRRREHVRRLNRDTHDNQHLRNAWVCHGSGAFTFETLEHCPEQGLIEREDWWINLLDTMNPDRGYNLRSADRQIVSEQTRQRLSKIGKGRPKSPEHRERIGAAHRGMKRPPMPSRPPASPETRAKISAAMKGRQAHNKGKPMSEAVRRKLSEAQKGKKGKPWTEEQRQKMITALTGQTRSEETKRKISEVARLRQAPRDPTTGRFLPPNDVLALDLLGPTAYTNEV